LEGSLQGNGKSNKKKVTAGQWLHKNIHATAHQQHAGFLQHPSYATARIPTHVKSDLQFIILKFETNSAQTHVSQAQTPWDENLDHAEHIA
jgi:hypothetical protein